ncbi:MAG: HD family phosphohydrolase [bacterium]
MFPYEPSFQFVNLKEGDVYIGKEIIAPFTFFINKSEEEYNRDKKLTAEKVPAIFVRVDSIEKVAIKNLEQFFEMVENIRNTVTPDSLKIRKLQDILYNYSIIIEKKNLPFLLIGRAIGDSQNKLSSKRNRSNRRNTKVKSEDTASEYEAFKRNTRRIITDIYTIGILNITPVTNSNQVKKISVISNGAEILEDFDNFFKFEEIEQVLLDKLRQTYSQREVAVKIGYQIINTFLQPNLIYNATETENRIQEAVAKVPLAKGTVLAKERIIDTHERITKETLEKLISLAQAIKEREAQESGIKRILPFAGKILITLLSLSFTVLFLFVSRPEIFYTVKKMIMIFIIFLVILFVTFLINRLSLSAYLIPIAIASMLLTIFFDTRTAFIGTVTLSLLIGALRGNEFGIMIISLFVGTISTFTVREIQARSWILKGILSISGAYIFSIGTIEFIRLTSFMNIWEHWLYGIINGLLSPILTYGIMIIFEYIFKMTTDSTLLELSDLNKPLLRQLAIRAPGTYHHSIVVGNLAEAAAEAIDTNALLARVGAYYHDIGKMEKPEYFVENQKGGKNPHEKLTPSMSCLILINHVKRGLEIAEEYNLPKEIRNFIPQHHGCNLISFFYKKALEKNNGIEINEADFRYPGPRSQSKETGIVMLADGVEAASRTLKDPTVSRIRSMVNGIIQERLADSELDECPLTVKDLYLIRESFVNILTGIFHGRIEYPEQEKKFFRRRAKTEGEKTLEVTG